LLQDVAWCRFLGVVVGIILDFMVIVVVVFIIGIVSAKVFFGNRGTMGTTVVLGLFWRTAVFLGEQCMEQVGTVGNKGNKVLVDLPEFSRARG